MQVNSMLDDWCTAVSLPSLSDSQTNCQWMIQTPWLGWHLLGAALRKASLADLQSRSAARLPNDGLSDIGVRLVGSSTP
jgi:hypothetical protein